MCSISGIWRLNGQPVQLNEIKKFNESLAYRGPDDDGLFIDESKTLALGHNRLAILDLSEAGRQPMFSQNGNLVITFNGEIYNYIELRQELNGKGHRFQTGTDTEVILAAYEEWGEACQLRFNGMWAFAIWDIEEGSLFLSRDRFGVKPLYYVYEPGTLFSFASESIAFKFLAGYNRSINQVNLDLGIRHAFYLESIGETIYSNIHKLLPGHCMKIDRKKSLVTKKWWKSEDHLISPPKTYTEQIEMFKSLLLDSCKLRLRSDVPIGTALSGGLDSSTVYCSIQQIFERQIASGENENANWKNAFTACFPNTKMDEQHYADEVVNYAHGISNHIFFNEADVSSAIYDGTKAEDFIYLSPPVVHSIYKEMREKGVKVSLDGHGADELLFGYPQMIAELMNQIEDEGSHLISTWADMSGVSSEDAMQIFIKSKPAYDAGNGSNFYSKYVPEVVKRIYRSKVKRNGKNRSWMLRDAHYKKTTVDSPHVFKDVSLGICYNEIHNNLPTLLRNWDRASMRHGVEIRMPFLDWRLVTFLLSLPQEAKVGNGYSKKIVRDAMKGAMPDSIRLRKNKIGINAPLEEWFNGSMSGFLLDVVNSQSFLKSDTWDGLTIRNYVEAKTKSRQWTQKEALDLWPYLNAWILMN